MYYITQDKGYHVKILTVTFKYKYFIKTLLKYIKFLDLHVTITLLKHL